MPLLEVALAIAQTRGRLIEKAGPLLYLQDASKYPLSIGLTFFSSQSPYDVQVNLLMAASTLVILPVVLMFLSFQRAFVEGVTVGGGK
ncbi:MAG: hypothetical protein ACR2J8_07600 [Thermomicrobiales bacterium]